MIIFWIFGIVLWGQISQGFLLSSFSTSVKTRFAMISSSCSQEDYDRFYQFRMLQFPDPQNQTSYQTFNESDYHFGWDQERK